MLRKIELPYKDAISGNALDAAPSQAVVILGMHRSGTSVVARLCNILGVSLGENLLPPEQGNNETGFWEHAEIVETHDALLGAFGSGWDDITLLPDGWEKNPKVAVFKQQLIDIATRDFAHKPLWGIKDPRFIKVMALWKDIFQELGIDPVYVVPLRNPYEIAESLHKRDGMPLHYALLLWLEYALLTMRDAEDTRYVFVSYDGILKDWRKEMEHISKGTGISWPHSYAEIKPEVDNFLDASLRRHQRKKEGSPLHPVEQWVDQAWAALLGLADGKDVDVSRLWQEIWLPMQQQRDVMLLYYGNVKAARYKMLEAYTALHEKNLAEKGTVAEYRKCLAAAHAEIHSLSDTLEMVYNSRSWKITAPIRMVTQLLRLVVFACSPATQKKMVQLVRTHGVKRLVKGTLTRLKEDGVKKTFRNFRNRVQQELHYSQWIIENDMLDAEDKERIVAHIKNFSNKPLISIVMPVYNIQEVWLRQAIDSVLAQLYPHWELCIADDCSTLPHVRQVLEEYQARDTRIKLVFRPENGHISESSNSALALATGEYVALFDHDDILPEHALYYVAEAVNRNPAIDMVYSDEDKINDEGQRFSPYFKSDWNPDLFYTQNMFSHLGVYRRSILEKIGGFRKGYEGSQDYDLALRASLHTDPSRIHHIPKVLYHWRAIAGSTAVSLDSKGYAAQSSRRAVTDYMVSAFPGQDVKVVDSHGVAKHRAYHRVIWPIPDPAPKVTILIPTRNGYSLLKTCVESLLDKTNYSNYEIVILNNQSDDPKTLEYMASLVSRKKARVVDYDHPFNYSAMNNMGVAATDGELLAFLNNDIEVISPEWLNEMVGHALRPEIGAVGAKLYYPNDTIQHGGVILGVGTCEMPVASHAFYHLSKKDAGYYARAILVQNFSAVTAACLVMRRDVFQEIGGFEEERLKVAFNDVDLCLKAQEKGYRNLWTPYAELYHHESATRGYDGDSPEKIQRSRKEQEYMRERWGDLLDNDPYYNPNLNIHRGDFSLAEVTRVRKPWG